MAAQQLTKTLKLTHIELEGRVSVCGLQWCQPGTANGVGLVVLIWIGKLSSHAHQSKNVALAGFKSFKDKVLIGPLAEFTCVVGPNGCGKSVVVSRVACCWPSSCGTALQLLIVAGHGDLQAGCTRVVGSPTSSQLLLRDGMAAG